MSYTTLFKALGDAGWTGTLNDRMVAAMRDASGLTGAGYNTLLNTQLEATYGLGSTSKNFEAWKNAGFVIDAIAGGGAAIEYVGGYTANWTADGTDVAVPLTSLTGGLGSAPLENDIVIVSYHVGAFLDVTSASPPSGYTTIQNVWVEGASNDDTNHFVGYKVMGASPDTTVTFPRSSASSSCASALAIMVFRNVDTASPLDVTSTTATQAGSALINPPAITPSSSGAWIVSSGSNTHRRGVITLTDDSSDFTTFLAEQQQGTTFDTSLALGYTTWDEVGAFDPATWGWVAADSANYTWAAATFALKPA